jgi:hypothetical protein
MERHVSTRWDRAGEVTDFFNNLLGTIYLLPSRPLLKART